MCYWQCGWFQPSAKTPCPAPSTQCAPAEWASRTPWERSLALACLFLNYQVSHLNKSIFLPLRDQLWIGPDNIWNHDFIGAELVPISKVSRQLMLYTCFLTKVKLDLKFSDSLHLQLDLVRDHYGHCLQTEIYRCRKLSLICMGTQWSNEALSGSIHYECFWTLKVLKTSRFSCFQEYGIN